GEGMFIRDAETVVPLFAEADVDNHYHFVNWTGDVSTIADVDAASTTITMNTSYSITANFELEEGWYSLTIFSTEGGSVTTPGEGTSVHAANTTIDLVAEPNEGYQFLKWTGNVSTIADIYAAATNITMNDSYSIAATFKTSHPEPVMVTLTVSSTAGGSVTTPGEGPFSYPLGTEASLVAAAASGYQFTRWSGGVETIADIDDSTTTIIMNGDYSITANFVRPGLLPCFIATAAYGTPMAEEIEILREFRDEYLLTNPAGQALVGLYYTVSPPIAEFITEHPSLKPIVRAGLLPAVAMSAVAVNTTVAEKMVIAVLPVLVSVAMAVWSTRRRARGPDYT
ncbi:MAG: CFI-box-CTERM domain-containing protein, partial [Chloroflexota bacterium]|nr:CFI-box-CTERM domain-containing protein [Chloroflexota bacterium]